FFGDNIEYTCIGLRKKKTSRKEPKNLLSQLYKRIRIKSDMKKHLSHSLLFSRS
ncbi:unnamed protein product, partial [Prunus brigantina]